MMRGVNRQNIFQDEEDYYKFLDTLEGVLMPYDEQGHHIDSYCTIYAYCIMTNHVHLLIQEKTEPIGTTIKRIAVSYAYYYNKKYGRESTLFHDRFRSEPCNDYGYFWRLLRYIHRNPVKAGITLKPEDYQWSSWHEYLGDQPIYFPLCNMSIIHRLMQKFSNSQEELTAFVNDGNIEDDDILDMPEDLPVRRITDEQAWRLIAEEANVKDPTAFQKLSKETIKQVLTHLRHEGASIKQLQRLTGIGRGMIQRL